MFLSPNTERWPSARHREERRRGERRRGVEKRREEKGRKQSWCNYARPQIGREVEYPSCETHTHRETHTYIYIERERNGERGSREKMK